MAIMRAVTALVESFGMTTTAEGVETEEQLRRLRAEGCTEVQGYLFSPPVPVKKLAGVMRKIGRDLKAGVSCSAFRRLRGRVIGLRDSAAH